MSQARRRIFDPVGFLAGVGTAALALMLVCSVADVGLRLAFNRPLHGIIDIVEATLVLVAFLALPACFRRDEQIKVDVFDGSVSRRVLAVMRLVGELATLCLLALLSISALQPLFDSYRFGDVKSDFPIPIAGLLLAIEIALIVSVVVLLFRVIAQIRALYSGNRNDMALPDPHSEGTHS